MLIIVVDVKSSEKTQKTSCAKNRYRHDVYATAEQGQKRFMLTSDEMQKRKKAEELKLEQEDEDFLVELQQDAWIELKKMEEDELRSKVLRIQYDQDALEKAQQEASSYCLKIRKSQEAFDRFTGVVRTFYSDDTRLRNEKKRELCALIPFIMPSMFNRIDPVTGQAIAHALTPLHWDLDLLEKMRLNGVDFSVQSKFPDRFPGSTIGHNVAGMLLAKRNKIRARSYSHYEYQRIQGQIDETHLFFAWLLQHYPGIEKMISVCDKFNHKENVTMVEVLPKEDREKILQKGTKD